MSSDRDDPGMTHHVGDDCPGGHEGEPIAELERDVAAQRDAKREAPAGDPFDDPDMAPIDNPDR